MIRDVLAGLLVMIAAFFTLAAAVGIVRLPDLYTRMHAASKAGTLGSCVMMLALAIRASDHATATRALAGVAFFLLTAPISAHLLARAAYHAGFRLWRNSVLDEMSATSRGGLEQEKTGGAKASGSRK